MKNLLMSVMLVLTTILAANAQYGNEGYNNNYATNDDRYYYDNDFDWHWDIRVRISRGIQSGLLTEYEANMLYRQLEAVERKEYAYQADGFYSGNEQEEIWEDVIYLNRRLGVELADYDRSFYGFDPFGFDRTGFNRWFYTGGYDFYRFDKRGFGNIRMGYAPRPNYIGWYRNNDNHIAREYFESRSRWNGRNEDRRDFRGNVGRGDYDRSYQNRGNNYPNTNGGYSRGGNYNTQPNDRNSQGNGNYNAPNTQPNNDNYGRNPQGSSINGTYTQPNNDNYGRNPQGSSNNGNYNQPNNGNYGRNPQGATNNGTYSSPNTQPSSGGYGRGSYGNQNIPLQTPAQQPAQSPNRSQTPSQPNWTGGQNRGGNTSTQSPRENVQRNSVGPRGGFN